MSNTFILIGIYAALCFLYFIYLIKSKKEINNISLQMTVVICMPVVGFVLLMVMDYYMKGMYANETDYSYYIGDEKFEDLHYLKPINKQNEINKVSMEEAFQLNSNADKKQMVLETLSSDNVLDYIDVLKKALKDKDSETVHYATAVIMEIQRKLIDSLIKLRNIYQNDRNNHEAIINYEEALSKTIFSDVFDRNYLTKYIEWYIQLSDRLLQEDWALEKFYDNRIKLDFILEDYNHAKETCECFKSKNPYSEEMVNRYIEYCVKTYNKDLLNQFKEELNKLRINPTHNTLQYLNLFG